MPRSSRAKASATGIAKSAKGQATARKNRMRAAPKKKSRSTMNPRSKNYGH